MGMTCSLWSDYGVTERMIDTRLFPRILTLAQQMWYNGEALPFDIFMEKVRNKKEWFIEQGYRFGDE